LARARRFRMDQTTLKDRERLIAERAVLAFRESMRAMEAAAHGQGLAVTERAVQEQGRRITLLMMEEALKAAAEGEKGGSAVRPDAFAAKARR
jgi:hypothetical protein